MEIDNTSIKLKNFEHDIKLFIGCLVTSDITTISSDDIVKAVSLFKGKPGSFLVTKRSKNNYIDYVILDIDFTPAKK